MRLVIALAVTCLATIALSSEMVPWPPQMLFDQFGDERQALDLQAQQDMARWAWWMLVATLASVVIGAAGTCALIISIRETRKALDEAKRANELSEQSSIVETRPWIVVKNAKFDRIILYEPESAETGDVRYFIEGTLELKNVGKLPARRVRQSFRLNDASGEKGDTEYFGGIWVAPLEEVSIEMQAHGTISSKVFEALRGDLMTYEVSLRYDAPGYAEHRETIWQLFMRVPTGDMFYWNDLSLGVNHIRFDDAHHIRIT